MDFLTFLIHYYNREGMGIWDEGIFLVLFHYYYLMVGWEFVVPFPFPFFLILFVMTRRRGSGGVDRACASSPEELERVVHGSWAGPSGGRPGGKGWMGTSPIYRKR
jgi:hypothetical protein